MRPRLFMNKKLSESEGILYRSPLGIFNQSTNICNIFIYNVSYKRYLLGADDIVGVFFNNKLVGAAFWDTTQCGKGVCSVTVNGNNNSRPTEGYPNTGDKLSFKFFISKEKKIVESRDIWTEAKVRFSTNEFIIVSKLVGK